VNAAAAGCSVESQMVLARTVCLSFAVARSSSSQPKVSGCFVRSRSTVVVPIDGRISWRPIHPSDDLDDDNSDRQRCADGYVVKLDETVEHVDGTDQ